MPRCEGTREGSAIRDESNGHVSLPGETFWVDAAAQVLGGGGNTKLGMPCCSSFALNRTVVVQRKFDGCPFFAGYLTHFISHTFSLAGKLLKTAATRFIRFELSGVLN